MIPAERKKQIIEFIRQSGYVTVSSIAEHLYISEPTVRRDLRQLESEGQIHRTHGGATFNDIEKRFNTAAIRSQTNIAEKHRIAKAAMQLVDDGCHIMLGSGTTCEALAEMLNERNHLTVLITDLIAADSLQRNNKNQIELIGGTYDPVMKTIWYDPTLSAVDSRWSDLFFFSAAGIDINGISGQTSRDIPGKLAFAKHAQKTVLMMDHSKFYKHWYYQICQLKDIDVLITDSELDDDIESALRASGTVHIIAKD